MMKKFSIAMLIVAIALLVFAYQTGVTAGKIRHPEIEQGTFKK